jgi:hypothetical protein
VPCRFPRPKLVPELRGVPPRLRPPRCYRVSRYVIYPPAADKDPRVEASGTGACSGAPRRDIAVHWVRKVTNLERKASEELQDMFPGMESRI